MVELLAPAGDLEKLKIAILYGADAVYVGGLLFNLRANATNFTLDSLKEGIEFAHLHNKKVYVTVNIVFHDKEVNKLLEYLKELDKIKVDAIIVSDPVVIKLAKENTNLEIHLSTQQSSLNKETIEFYKNLGVTRIVLARETKKEDIKDIIGNVDIEIETFIHGAMCAGYSGRCVLSNYLTNRDANRGGCSQACRFDYDLYNGDKLLKKDKNFTFCTKDLSMLKYIPDMIETGIKSFKIEGRMRSIYYIATVVSIYRKVIDSYLRNKENYKYNLVYEKILSRCANRDSIPQFYDNNISKEYNYYNNRQEVSNQDFQGVILDKIDGYIVVEQRNYFKKGDVVDFMIPSKDDITFKIEEIIDEDNNIIEIVNHPKQIVKIKCDIDLPKFSMMKKHIDKF